MTLRGTTDGNYQKFGEEYGGEIEKATGSFILIFSVKYGKPFREVKIRDNGKGDEWIMVRKARST